VVKALGAATLGLVLAAIATGHLAEWTGAAVLTAMALNWTLELAGRQR
jgi:hypothetical protein